MPPPCDCAAWRALHRYWSGYSNCLPPSAKYGHDLLVASLGLQDPPVSGVTVYTTEVPHGSCPNAKDKGCIIKQLFGKAATQAATTPQCSAALAGCWRAVRDEPTKCRLCDGRQQHRLLRTAGCSEQDIQLYCEDGS